MNIGIVTTWFERGAGYVSRQYRDVLNQRHAVHIYARGGEGSAQGDPEWEASHVTWGKKVLDATAVDIKDFEKWLDKNKIELVIFNEQRIWEPVLFCNKLGIKTGAYVDYYTEETVRFFDIYDFMLCNTQRHYSVFSWHPQCFYIPWGTNITLFKPKTLEAVSPDQITFFHSAGMSPDRKGTDLVLKAFADIVGPVKLVIHSQVELEPFFPELVPLMRQLQQKNRLETHYRTVAAPGLYHLGDVYVYPTRLDGIGLSINEALACGLPVITCDNPPMNEFVKHGVNGRLVPVSQLIARSDGYYWPQCFVSQESLFIQMNWYIENLANLASFKKQARDRAEQHLDWSKNAVELGNLLTNVRKRPAQEIADSTRRTLLFDQRVMPLRLKYKQLYNLYTLGKRVISKLK